MERIVKSNHKKQAQTHITYMKTKKRKKSRREENFTIIMVITGVLLKYARVSGLK